MVQSTTRRLSITDFVIKRSDTAPLTRDRNTSGASATTTASPTDSPDVGTPLTFTDDVATMPTSDLLRHGERFASAFLTQCGRARHVSRRSSRYSTSLGRGQEKAKNVYCKYDNATKVYSVHAVMEIRAGLKEVLHLLAGDVDPSSARHGFNVFLWRVFGPTLAAATNLRSTRPPHHRHDDDDDDDACLTMKQIHHSYEGAAIKQATFLHSNLFFGKSKRDWLLLDYIQKRSDASVVRVFKSVDNATSYVQTHKGKVVPRHTRLCFGFHVEELSFRDVCRVTFYGTHEATTAHHASHRLLQKLGESLHMIDLAVLRRRLGQRVGAAPSKAVAVDRLGDTCVHCAKFTNGVVCRLCSAQVCADCSSIQHVETAPRNVFELRVCTPCVTKALQKTKAMAMGQHHPPPVSLVAPTPQRGMFRISEATLEGSVPDHASVLQT
ncbi:Aste57867_25346 [Aphanomyces stellatus]|uniref:Aste57867_25346 protein n=1 Tax=Aphanomyces stellatus TaxID=120398 RepID=A0A485LT04_9STRA|nr:hypothetical protein As57867_025268 [Aphanomyces stellatus]VFU01971.1 Aste57867_25346 [Aphanomyces stellatus]